MSTSSAARPGTAAAQRPVGTLAVVAHRRKTLGGGLDELRSRLLAGTANLFAANLGIPADLPEALRIALPGPAALTPTAGRRTGRAGCGAWTTTYAGTWPN